MNDTIGLDSQGLASEVLKDKENQLKIEVLVLYRKFSTLRTE